MLAEDFGVASDIWSATSFTLLRRDGLETERWNMLHPGEPPRRPYVCGRARRPQGADRRGERLHKTFVEQIRPFVDRRLHALGTDGYGRSDTRKKLREFFEVDRRWVALAALKALADDGQVPRDRVGEAIKRYGIDPDKPNPVTV